MAAIAKEYEERSRTSRSDGNSLNLRASQLTARGSMGNNNGLNFFRRLPENINDLNPLLSSFQSFETSIELMAICRYPAAVIACANAWEAVMKAYLKKDREDEVGLAHLISEILREKRSLRQYREGVYQFRKARNDLTHFGVSPGDDQKGFDLLLSVGYPFYSEVVRECFGLYLNWRDLVPEAEAFEDIGSSDEGKCLLVPSYGDALFGSIALHKEFGFDRSISDNRFCAARLSYIVGDSIKQDFVGAREHFADIYSDEYFRYLNSRRDKIENYFDWSCYDFICPVCDDHNFIGEIDGRSTKEVIYLDRGVCVECDFQIGKGNNGVLDRLLHAQVKEKMPDILEKFKDEL